MSFEFCFERRLLEFQSCNKQLCVQCPDNLGFKLPRKDKNNE